MGVAKALISGAVAAVSVTLLHELTRKTTPKAPRLDVLGMKAVARGADAIGLPVPGQLRKTAMAGDLLANTAYYSLAALGGQRGAIATGAALGAAAGVGAVMLPGPIGLGGEETNRTHATQAMAAGMYFVAGVVAGAVYQALAAPLGEWNDDSPLFWVP